MFNTSNHAIIPPVKKGNQRPFWSVVIPTYNCASFLEETLKSVLSQDPGKDFMEIIVIDDHSTIDDPEAVVTRVGKGRVHFQRQSNNVGKSENYAEGIKLSKGHFIHLLHGDDTVSEGFYKKMKELFEKFPQASVGFCQCNYIGIDGKVAGDTELLSTKPTILDDFILTIAVWQKIQPPSIVFKREVYEHLGGYDNRLKYIEDWEFYVRSAVYYKFAYLPENLANYRIFQENSSSKSIKGGKRIKTIKQLLSIIDNYLPQDVLSQIKKPRNRAISVYLVNYIPQRIANFDIKGFFVVSKTFFSYNRSLRLFGRWLKFILFYKNYLN